MKLPTPTAVTPASNQSWTFSGVTPPVGARGTCGSGAITVLTYLGPRNSAGNNMTMSALAWTVSTISVGVNAPLIKTVWYRLDTAIISGFSWGLTSISAAAWTAL